MGAFGLNHKIILGKKSLLNNSVAFTGSDLISVGEKMDTNKVLFDDYDIQNTTWSYILSSTLNHKFSARHSNRTGVTFKLLNYDMLIQHAETFKENLTTLSDNAGNSELIQAYTQSRLDLTERFILTAGIHFQYFTLNKKYAVEPRFGARYKLSNGQSVNIGYGLHSRLEMLFVYLGQQQTESGLVWPNQNLGFSRAHHFVLGYDKAMGENLNFRTEVYYQYLFDVPVEQGTSFSMLNVDQDWYINQPLTNDGTGENYGIDLTLERFMNDGYYFVMTGSLFESTYVGGDGIKRDSRFNKNFVFNLLGGKEWQVGRGHKNNSAGINGKFSVNGGDRQTPVDEAATYAMREVVYDDSHAFAEQKPTVYYLHITINYRKNKPNHSSIWSFQILNALGAPEYFGYRFNYRDDTIDRDEQTIVIPNISYKIVF